MSSHVLRLQAMHTVIQFLGLFRIVRVHGEGKLGLDQARADAGHPNVVLAQLSGLLTPSLQQTGDGKLGAGVEAGGAVGGEAVAGHAIDKDDLAVVNLVLQHGLDAELGAEA